MFDFLKKRRIGKRTLEERLLDALDNEYGFRIAKELLQFRATPKGFRLAGTKEENDAADWIAEQMRRIGLQNVQKEAFPVDTWDYRGASITVLGGTAPEAAELLEIAGFAGVTGTGEAGVTGTLVYVGDGTAANYEGIDVQDRVVVIDTDAYHSWPYAAVFAQAEHRGAKAVIALPAGGPGTYRDDLITIQDVLGTAAIPCVMSSKGGGDLLRAKLLAGDELTVNIHVRATVSPGRAHYVHGELPGRNPDRYLLVTGHYDAYWDGFQDNATSLGSLMTIAKALIDIGYQPEGTIVFAINGAEEYGLADNYFDFACGANAIVRQHPEWVRGGIALNNFELSAHCETDGYIIACSHGYVETIDRFLEDLEFVTDTMAVPDPSVQADDVVISKSGIPAYMNVYMYEASGPDSFELYDHTAWDNVERFQPEVFEKNNKVFALLDLMMDQLPVMPLDLTEFTAWFRDEASFEHLPELYPDWDHWERTLETFEASASRMADMARTVNADYLEKRREASREDLSGFYEKGWTYTEALKQVNGLMQREIVKYDAFMGLMPGHSQPAMFTIALQALIEELEAGKPGEALDRLLTLGNNYLIPAFDKEVYEMVALHAFTPEETAGTWGEGGTLPFPDLYDVLHAVMEGSRMEAGDLTEEIEVLRRVRGEQHELLCRTLVKEQELLRQCIGILTEVLPEGGGLQADASAAGPDRAGTSAADTARRDDAGKNYSIHTKVRDLVADPQAVAVLEELAPGISSHPDLEWVMGMKLKSVAPLSGGLLTKELLAKMDEALRKL